MAVPVRQTLERLGHTVGYDSKTGGVTVQDKYGNTVNIGSEGFTLGDDNRYYADSAKDIYSALAKNGLSTGSGWSAVRNTLSPTESVGYDSKTGQLAVNGKTYNVDGENLVNIGGVIYGKNNYVNSLKKEKYENNYEKLEREILEKLANNEYKGYDPASDEDYQRAFDDYLTKAKADMGARGITSDSLIAHYASEGAAKLMPQFAKADYEKYLDENDRLKSTLSAIKNLETSDRKAFETRQESDYKTAEFEANREKNMLDEIVNELNMAVKRAKLSGVVSESDAKVLGVEAGTLTAEEREKIENRLYETEKLRLQKELEVKAYGEKSQKDLEREKEIARLQNDLNISLAQATSYYKAIYGR